MVNDSSKFISLDFERLAPEEQLDRAEEFLALMRRWRTVRAFSSEPVPLELIKLAIETAGSAPSGANQNWGDSSSWRNPIL